MLVLNRKVFVRAACQQGRSHLPSRAYPCDCISELLAARCHPPWRQEPFQRPRAQHSAAAGSAGCPRLAHGSPGPCCCRRRLPRWHCLQTPCPDPRRLLAPASHERTCEGVTLRVEDAQTSIPSPVHMTKPCALQALYVKDHASSELINHQDKTQVCDMHVFS